MVDESPPKEMVVQLPQLANGHRMETGPLQFGADWPGVLASVLETKGLVPEVVRTRFPPWEHSFPHASTG